MIWIVQYTMLACLTLALLIGSVSPLDRRHYDGRPYPVHRFSYRSKLLLNKTVYVSNSDGKANFSTIQSAIDSVPSNNQEWICIFIKAGTYREQVAIPADKPYIYIQGEGKKKTTVVWDAHLSIQTPTFASEADNIVVKSITFQNSYNNPPNGRNPTKAAVAAYIAGDKSAFYRVRFLGFQDTLWDQSGRHYFKLCTIQGAVDFIFGSGQSIYESSTISVLAKSLGGPGFITAQGRTTTKETNGFVFKDCHVVGNGLAYLGRPWREYATVIFYKSNLSEVVHPLGWNPWDNQAAIEGTLTYAEDSCIGKGANTSQRVKWERKLSNDELNWYTSMSYIDTEGWIQKQPFHMLS